MIDWPKPISGMSVFAAWLNRFLGKAKTCTPLESKDFRIEFTTNGYFLRPKFQTFGGGTPGKTTDANYKLMAIVGLGSLLNPPIPDLLICSTCDPSTVPPGVGNDTVYVAKARNMRINTPEFFADNGANVTQKYTYFGPSSNDASYGDNFRSATDFLNTEVESVVPRYCMVQTLDAAKVPREQSFIYVVDLGTDTGVFDPRGGRVTKMEVLPMRVWSKVVNA